MGVITDGKIYIHGNFSEPKRYKNGRPKNWFNRDYKAIVPYPFKWRTTLGKVECDCVEIVEAYQPYYGWTYFHSKECAVIKHYNKYPQMENFIGYYRDVNVIAQSE